MYIDTIFKDFKEELLDDDQYNNLYGHNKGLVCPELTIKLNNVEVVALIDSGSQLCVISEHWYNYHKERLGKTEILSLANTTVRGAPGNKSKIIKKQVLLKVEMLGFVDDVVFLVIPNLNRDCIIGIDLLRTSNCIIEFKNNNIKINVKTNSNSANNEAIINHLQVDRDTTKIDFKETVDEIDTMNPEQRKELINILNNNVRVF